MPALAIPGFPALQSHGGPLEAETNVPDPSSIRIEGILGKPVDVEIDQRTQHCARCLEGEPESPDVVADEFRQLRFVDGTIALDLPHREQDQIDDRSHFGNTREGRSREGTRDRPQ